LAKPYRSYRAGWVFRNEKPGPGRFRQFMQFDADTVGAGSSAADAEICMMAADTLEALGIKRGDYVIKVNNRKVLDGVMDGAEIPEESRLIVLRAFDKFDRLGVQGVARLLGAGRRDESGDFTRGAGLADEKVSRLLALAGWGEAGASAPAISDDSSATLANLRNRMAGNARGQEGAAELSKIAELVERAGYGPDRIQIDPSIVRGLEYYTGPVFEAQLTFAIANEEGRTVQFGSVGGGGRYDGLVSRFRGETVPATGFSIGVSRLHDALRLVESPIVTGRARSGPVVVLVMDRDRIGDYQEMAAWLRGAGIPAEIYLGSAGMKPQMKYADRRNAPCVIIQGSNEKAAGEVQVKDLVEGARQAEAHASHADYKAARSAQFSVRAEPDALVAAVRALISAQSG
jgi:histidyl-tRNA synthetase